jgi:hypothetical protein
MNIETLVFSSIFVIAGLTLFTFAVLAILKNKTNDRPFFIFAAVCVFILVGYFAFDLVKTLSGESTRIEPKNKVVREGPVVVIPLNRPEIESKVEKGSAKAATEDNRNVFENYVKENESD